MPPIGKLRKPDWELRDPDKREAAVRGSSAPSLLERLPTIARDDDSPAVRLAAVERIDDPVLLISLLDSEPDDGVRNTCRSRVLALLARSEAPDLEASSAFLRGLNERERLTLLRDAASVALRLRLLREVNDPAVLAERTLKDPDRRLREEALSRIDDAQQLERVVKATRRGDKKLHRLAGERLESLQLAAGDPEAARRRAERLVERLEVMARAGDVDADKRAWIESQWRDLPEAGKAPLQARFDGARRILERAATPPPPAQPTQKSSESKEPSTQPIPEQLREIAREAGLLAEQETPSMEAAAELEKRWNRHWADSLTREPEAEKLRRHFLERLASARHRVEQAQQNRRNRAAKMASLVDELERHLEAGDLQQARAVDHDLKRELGRLGGKPPATIKRRIAAAHRRLHELRDWQHWANNRIRQRLCEQVEALPESDLHPDAVLEALKKAQAEWRELENSEKLSGESKAYRASGPALWRRFQSAGKRAFEHVQPFLEKRSELRQHNLEQVEALLARLDELEQAEELQDTQAMTHALSQARKALKSLNELPPAKRGQTAKRLRHYLDSLGRRLDERRDALAARKRALIEEAASLDPDRDLDEAIRQAKRLMAQWKRVDTLPRGRERKLWRELRAHLDPIFERRDAEQARAREAQAEEQTSLEAMCEQAEAIADLPGSELAQATAELNRLRGQWQSHRNRPKTLEKRFRAALDNSRHRLAEHRAAVQLQTVRGQILKARLCWQLESGELDQEQALAAWEESPELPEAIESDLRRRLGRARETPSERELADNREQAERLVLTMELVSGVESPPEASAARMELKVQRLNEQMRGEHRAEEPEAEMERLLREWSRCGPLPGEQGVALEKRIIAALEAFHGRPILEN